MLYKIFFPAVVFLIYLSFNFNFYQQDKTHKKHPVITITGDEPPVRSNTDVTVNPDLASKEPVFMYSDSLIQITDVYTGEASLYDLQSNGVTQHCWQNPSSPNDIHLVFMWNQTQGIPAANRRTKYIVSTDRGATWINIGEVPSGASAGFVCCHGLDDGRIAISNHSSPTLPVRNHVFVEISAGTGTFSTFDPGTDPSLQKIWPRITTASGTPGKVVFVASQSTVAATIAYTNSLTSFTPPGMFTGFVGNPDITNAEQYALDRATNGTIGLAYIRHDFVMANMGDVRYISSTNDGLTWSAPVTVYDAPFAAEFYGALRGIDLVFQGNVPKVTFDLVKFDSSGGFYPAICSKVMFWSPNVNGGVTLPLADSTHHPCVTLGERTSDDVFTNFCRATIGRSANNSCLFAVYNVARTEILDSVNYYDIYIVRSGNGGASWLGRTRLTNISGPLRDCRYPSISPSNDVSSGLINVNIEYQSDSIPGSHVNGSDPSLAKQRFIRVSLQECSFIGIEKINNELPQVFKLHQNYPNPFNPKTIIKFDIPSNVKRETSNVKLIIYDILGKEVDVLVNEELKPGTYEVDFDGTEYPSGVYFYELRVTNDELRDEYKETRKMVLIR